MVRTAAHRLARRRVHARAHGDAQVDAVEEAFVLRDRRVDERRELGDRVAARVAERRPRLDVRAVVGAGEVDDQPVAVDRDRDVHVDVVVAGRVGVDVDVGFVHAVGPAGDLLGEAAAGVGDRPVDRGAHRLGAVLLHDLGEPLDAEPRRADLRAQVADEPFEPVVGAHREHDVAPLPARLDDLQQRVARALRPDVLGEDVVAAGHRAAGVAVMALDRRDQQQRAVVVEHRREHVEVGEVPAAVVRVVGDDHVTRVQLVAEEVDREPHRQCRAQHELRDADRQRGEAAVSVEDRRVALVALVQDRRRRGARHERRHLEAHRLHRGADDLGRDLIDGVLLAHAVSLARSPRCGCAAEGRRRSLSELARDTRERIAAARALPSSCKELTRVSDYARCLDWELRDRRGRPCRAAMCATASGTTRRSAAAGRGAPRCRRASRSRCGPTAPVAGHVRRRRRPRAPRRGRACGPAVSAPATPVAFQLPNWVEAAATFYAVVLPRRDRRADRALLRRRRRSAYILRRTRVKAFVTADRFGHLDFLANLDAMLPGPAATSNWSRWSATSTARTSPVRPTCSTHRRSTARPRSTRRRPRSSRTRRAPPPTRRASCTRTARSVPRSASSARCRPTGRPVDRRCVGAPVGHGIGMLAALLSPVWRRNGIHLIDVWDPRARARRRWSRTTSAVGRARPSSSPACSTIPTSTPAVHLELMTHVGLGGAAVPGRGVPNGRRSSGSRSCAPSGRPSTRRSPAPRTTTPLEKRLLHRRPPACRESRCASSTRTARRRHR